MSFVKKVATTIGAAALLATTASAATTNLRIQTHFSPETLSGQMAAEFVDDIHAMSGGDIAIEMFYSSSVVKSAETFDAAATGILDCDMTGGYENPYQQMAWLLHGGGYDALNSLYNQHNMEFVGWWIPGPESLSSTRPIRGVEDFKNWKFRSPPGIITMIFEELGASPIVMDFNEIFTALETGIIDGADAANLTNNIGLGLYDIAKHTNYPGFHSMPADHLACRKDVWDGMPDAHKAILKVGMQALALKNTTINEVKNAENSVKLAEQGLNMYEWSPEELAKYRTAVQEAWVKFATTPESKELLESHLAFLRGIGAME